MRHIKAFENFLNQDHDLGRFSDENENFPLLNNNDDNTQDENNCEPCEDEENLYDSPEETDNEEERDDKNWNDEQVMIERFSAFLEGKKKEEKGKTPKTEKEKELAKKWGDPNKITKGDFIASAIENKKKGNKEDKKESDKKSEKGLSAAQKKLPAALQKAILAKKK